MFKSQNEIKERKKKMSTFKNSANREELPLVMSAHDLQAIGFSRSMSYQLLNRKDFPVVEIGGRKFVNRDKFFQWLDNQTN